MTPEHTQPVAAIFAATETEARIEAMLRELAPAVVGFILGRLLLKLVGDAVPKVPTRPQATNGAAPERREQAPLPLFDPLRGPATKKTRGRWRGAHGDKTRLLTELLTGRPHTPIPQMAEAIYGDSGATSQKNLRSLLNGLKRAGKAHNPEPGKWEIKG